jgi:predicted  nucleic acid-binding Zn-ribbon protein
VVAYHDPGSDTITRLPDPEWDRIDALEDHIAELERRIAALQQQLEAAARHAESPEAETGEPLHLHRSREEHGEPIAGREALSG